MTSILKVLAAVFGAVLLTIIGLFGFLTWLAGDSRGCNPDGKAVAYARSLPQERLARLYQDMQKYHEIDQGGGVSYIDLPEFSDLEVGVVRPWRSSITVEGCFDDFVHMIFEGLDGKQEPSIRLSCGEREDFCADFVLWTSDAT